MSTQFTRDHVKIATAKILQTLGWHSINTTPLEIFADILSEYISQLGRITHDYANEFGVIEPNLDHLGLAFREMGINITDLEEYVKYVNFVPAPANVPKYPIPKENSLNFLKPGSSEVVTRPVHIHEHLPPMFPILEGVEAEKEALTTPAVENEQDGETVTENGDAVFKKPPDITAEQHSIIKKRREEEALLLRGAAPIIPTSSNNSRPTREISSVMMTTSGFLSPAREGKLPESKTPIPPPGDPPLPAPKPQTPPVTAAISPSTIMDPPAAKKVPKAAKRSEKKKEKPVKELFKPNHEGFVKTKKESAKMKQLKQSQLNNANQSPNIPVNLSTTVDLKISSVPSVPKSMTKVNNKVLQAARDKTEKLNTTITAIPMKSNVALSPQEKLAAKLEKRKKQRKTKAQKAMEKFLIKEEAAHVESPPDLIIDMPEDNLPKVPQLPKDITIEPINPPSAPLPHDKLDMQYYDSFPRPATPSTPKIPEFIPPVKEKRKKKEKAKPRKIPKMQPNVHMFPEDVQMLDRPKTPDAHLQPPLFKPDLSFSNAAYLAAAAGRIPFPTNFGGPGLIPPPFGNPLANPLINPSFQFFMDLTQHRKAYPPTNFPPNFPNPLAGLIPPNNKQPLEDVPPPSPPNPQMEVPMEIEKEPVVEEKVETPSTTTMDEDDSIIMDEPIVPSKHDKKSKEHKKEKKEKKKNKKEKDKDKKAEKKEKKERLKKEKKEKRKEKELQKEEVIQREVTITPEEHHKDPTVPKITLRLSPSSTSAAVSSQDHGLSPPHKKLLIKPVVKREPGSPNGTDEGETSTNLAKISALVTGPPKQKNNLVISVTPTSTNYDEPPLNYTIVKKKHKKRNKIAENVLEDEPPVIEPPRVNSPQFTEQIYDESLPPQIVGPLRPTKNRNKFLDSMGREVWICPACKNQDDGSPMIGCDGCDAWYHWVCVGIQVPPDVNENWYCRHCILKKNSNLETDKKKKRKRRGRTKENV